MSVPIQLMRDDYRSKTTTTNPDPDRIENLDLTGWTMHALSVFDLVSEVSKVGVLYMRDIISDYGLMVLAHHIL